MAIEIDDFKDRMKKMLKGDGFFIQGYYEEDDNTFGPSWPGSSSDVQPEDIKETARHLSEVIAKHILRNLQDPKGNPYLIPNIFRGKTSTMGSIMNNMANKIEDALEQMIKVKNPAQTEIKLRTVYIPLATTITSWLMSQPLNFLITHKSPSNVPTSNVLTFPGNPATLGKDIGLAFKKSGSSADSIANKVTNSLAKAFEDWIDSCRGTYVEVAPNGTVLTTNWTGLK